ncbi:poly(A)-specific ribonuclease PNLDC1 isoform X3 [Taeniopygia guttata]|uniref:poly(A)-specific ribonuclease PNLDC1 isoform X3 n=1 Tax=Taeniopygia guttata TaxID=59729 RepID=UPI003BB852E6
MDVGAEGFAQRLPRLRRRIKRAAFVALDMEFTGLHSTSLQNNEPSLFDSPAERYMKARQSVQRFSLVQLGLAIFSKENSNKYVVHSYNFFLFPSTLGIRDVEFTVSASSIQFLSHYGFDYNKFLKDGIPYMNEVQEESLRQHLLADTWKVCSTNVDRDVLKKAIDEVTSWIVAAKEEDTMILQDLNGYHMIEVQLVLRQALENVWTEPLEDNKVMVKKVSPEHRQLLENSSDDHCQKKLILLSARGFTNLFQILVKVKKPLVGHNMLMDLMHLHDKFYRPLPESYEEFKRNIHNLFPVIIDTKTVTKSVQKLRRNLLMRLAMMHFSVVQFFLCQLICYCADPQSLCPTLSLLWQLLDRNSCPELWGAVSSLRAELQPCFHCRVRLVLRDYRRHPHLQVSVYRHWRHSPSVNCLLQISGIVALWSLLAFVLGGTRSC